MSKTTRTTYVAHVGNVTVSVNGALETVRGPIPTCRTCGRLLRPNYATTRSPYTEASKTLTRLFKGSFGAYSDNRFCGLSCGHTWAVRNCKEQPR